MNILPLVELVPLIFFSVLAFWRPHVLLFMLVMGISMMVGLYWFDSCTDSTGLTVSLMLIGYSFVAAGFGLKVMLWDGGQE
jgi:hypothetical protein